MSTLLSFYGVFSMKFGFLSLYVEDLGLFMSLMIFFKVFFMNILILS